MCQLEGGSGGSLSSSQEPIEPNVANCTGLSSVIWQQKSHNQKGGICKKKKRNRLSPFLNTGPILEKFLKQTKHTVSLASCHLPHAPLRQTVMPPPSSIPELMPFEIRQVGTSPRLAYPCAGSKHQHQTCRPIPQSLCVDRPALSES